MNLKCAIGLHDWRSDCEKCASCGKPRTGAHAWNDCVCTKCGKRTKSANVIALGCGPSPVGTNFQTYEDPAYPPSRLPMQPNLHTKLRRAIKTNDLCEVKRILNEAPDIDMQVLDDCFYLIHLVCQSSCGKHSISEELFDYVVDNSHDASIAVIQKFGNSILEGFKPLHILAYDTPVDNQNYSKESIRRMSRLVSKGSDINERVTMNHASFPGATPLHIAINTFYIEDHASELLDLGASPLLASVCIVQSQNWHLNGQKKQIVPIYEARSRRWERFLSKISPPNFGFKHAIVSISSTTGIDRIKIFYRYHVSSNLICDEVVLEDCRTNQLGTVLKIPIVLAEDHLIDDIIIEIQWNHSSMYDKSKYHENNRAIIYAHEIYTLKEVEKYFPMKWGHGENHHIKCHVRFE